MKRTSGRRILVVEDELMVAMGIEMVLTDAGYTVIGPVGRFDQALAAAAEGDMDFALLDVNVRGSSVFPVAEILEKRHIPFAFLTGYGRESLPPDRARARVFAKPFKASDLLAAVQEMCA